MRNVDLSKLTIPYNREPNNLFDHRFESSIGADIPSAERLVEEIFSDLDEISFGIRWWRYLPDQERILISDYLYQCADGIEVNLVEAKLHYLEWLDAREEVSNKIADIVTRNARGKFNVEFPAPQNAVDDLPRKLENMHICGFFRAIGSTLDCIGSTIVGVLALPISLRRSDIIKAEQALSKVKSNGSKENQIRLDFKDYLETLKKSLGPEDWLEWADQYRNMFVHRGRRNVFHEIVPRENLFYDSKENCIFRVKSTTHLAKYPDRSETEALIKGKDIQLDEDAKVTLNGIFDSVRNLAENLCERLLKIWIERRDNSLTLRQPQAQWDSKIRTSIFTGYSPNSNLSVENSSDKKMLGNAIAIHRMLASSCEDKQRHLWKNSDWE